MAPYCDKYMSDFALMGVPKFDFQHFMETDMRDTMRHFEIQERVSSTVCIVADANTMKCNVFCAKAPALLPQAILDSGDMRGGVNGGGFNGGVGLDLRGEPVTRLPHASTSSFMDSTLHQMVDLGRSGLAAELVSISYYFVYDLFVEARIVGDQCSNHRGRVFLLIFSASITWKTDFISCTKAVGCFRAWRGTRIF